MGNHFLIIVLAHSSDLDLGVRGFLGVLFVAEDFFVEFFTGTKAGILDLDVLVGTEAGELNHATGQIGYLHRFAHIEDEDFATIAHGTGFEHQAAGFGDGHEEADDIRMRNRNRTAILDLFLETGNHRTVAAQDIAKTGGDELGLAGYFALLDGSIEALYIDFGQALATAHDVGGVHGLVGTYHHKLLDAVLHSDIGHIARTIYIDTDGFARIFFHQRDMLIGCGMEHYLGMVGAEGKLKAFLAAHIAYDRDELQTGELFLELEAEVVHRGFAHIEAHKVAHIELGELAADFATDTTGCTGNQHALALQQGADFFHIDLDLVATQEVFDIDATDGTVEDSVFHLFGVRHHQHTEVELLAETDEALLFFLGQGHVGEEDAVDIVVHHNLLEFVLGRGAIDTLAGKEVVMLAGVHQKEASYQVVGHVDLGTALGKLDALVVHSVNKDVLLLAIGAEQNDIIDIEQEDAENEEGHKGDEEIGTEEQQLAAGEQQGEAEDKAEQGFLDNHHEQQAPDFAQRGVADDIGVRLEQQHGQYRRHQRQGTELPNMRGTDRITQGLSDNEEYKQSRENGKSHIEGKYHPTIHESDFAETKNQQLQTGFELNHK